VADAEVKITDENGNTLEAGMSGDLRMRTTYMAKRYWHQPDSGSTGFIDGWFRPGDTGILEQGNRLRITGRVDELINAAGIKLNPALIDSRLAGYRGVVDLATFGYTVEGEIHKRLAVAIVTNGEISLERFRNHVLDAVPETSDILIVRVDEIPRNALGKPMRKSLALSFKSF
jgi:acyl-coenzyme A synthetase/AMP-(fatty) acid ligase